MKIAIIPGSYDPCTLGHVDIIQRASEIFDKVIPVVSQNSEKTGMFSPSQRLEIIKCACRNIENCRCICRAGLISDIMKEEGAEFIVKGIRNSVDFEYESSLARIMQNFYPSAKTVFLPANPKLSYISSTYAREKIIYNADLSDIAELATAELILSYIKK